MPVICLGYTKNLVNIVGLHIINMLVVISVVP